MITNIEIQFKKYIKNNCVKLDLKTGTEYMPIDEFARWCAFINGLDMIIDQAENLGINIHKSDSWIKPLPLEKYVNEKSAEYVDELNYINTH